MDELLRTLLGPWLAQARQWATPTAEANDYQNSAREIITLWQLPVSRWTIMPADNSTDLSAPTIFRAAKIFLVGRKCAQAGSALSRSRIHDEGERIVRALDTYTRRTEIPRPRLNDYSTSIVRRSPLRKQFSVVGQIAPQALLNIAHVKSPLSVPVRRPKVNEDH